jgi:ABC-type antimicrobial peptide transport system permease subunit
LLKVGLKGLLARKLRTFLTGFAVVIGVAFVAGTFVFTDTIDASFKDLFERASKGTDVSVQSRQAVEEDFATPPAMPPKTLDRVQDLPGVEEAAGFVSLDATLLDPEGEPIISEGRMVRGESVITAAIGAVLGILLGIAFAAILSRPLADEGFVFELPIGTLIVVAVVAALAGVLAAIPPARRAARVDVLRAVTTE